MSAQDITGQLPDTDGDEAREGTCAAWVAECCINDDIAPWDFVDETHENGWIVDRDMARHLEPYVAMARGRDEYRAECFHSVDISGITNAGTSDLWSTKTDRVFCVDDLKYGFETIEPMSWQIADYMMLAHDAGANFHNGVQLGIYQPRALHRDGPYRTIFYSYDQAMSVINTVLNRIREISVTLADPLASAGSHCDHCLKANGCEALTHSVYRLYSALESRAYDVPTGQQLSDEFDLMERMTKLLKARKSAVRAEIEGRLGAGQYVPGMVRERRQGKAKFNDNLNADMIRFLTGVDATEAMKLCTPAELKRRGVPADLVDDLTHNPYTGHELIRVTSDHIRKQFERKK